MLPASFPPHPCASPTSLPIALSRCKENNPTNSLLSLFHIEPIPGKELGAVASSFIKKGQLVISEKPLILFDAPFSAFLFSRSTDTDPEDDSTYSALDRHIGRAIDQLMESKSAQDKQCLLDLANTHPELPPSYGVFKTNAISARLSQGGLFPQLSRVNSSCRPNLSRPLWDRSRGVIESWALGDIPQGEELGWMYLDNSFRTKEERQEETLRVLGFKCGCPGCSLSPSELPLSDARVAKLKALSLLLSPIPLSGSSSASSSSSSPPETPPTGPEIHAHIQTIREMIPVAQEERMLDLVRELKDQLGVARKLWAGPRGMGRIEWLIEVYGDVGSEASGVDGGKCCRCCV